MVGAQLDAQRHFEARKSAHLRMTAGLEPGEVKANASYALAMSGNTASILVFNVAALNGLTM